MNGPTTPRWPPPDTVGLRGAVLRRDIAKIARSPEPPFPAGEGAVLVCAARPMDDILACGGTITRLVATGRPVHAFVASDGEATHPQQLSLAELGPLRRVEARRALGHLGVVESHMTFAGAPHGGLSTQIPALTGVLSQLLTGITPAAVLLPAAGSDSDTRSLWLAVTAASAEAGGMTQLFEYPVWAWRTWPFVRITFPSPRHGSEEFTDKATLLAASLRSLGGRKFVRSFPLAVDVRSELAKKREALAEHRSQVERREGDPHWWTLDDVDRGDFVRCFFAGYEPFRRVDRFSR